MSNNLRCLVERSLDDLVSIFDVYKTGNKFDGEYERGLPVMPQPIIINVVSVVNIKSDSSSSHWFGPAECMCVNSYGKCQFPCI
jgi:hypothetical protein